MMKVIGITGGTGSGKTTVLKVLEAMGAKTVDCDALYHALLEENAEMLAEIDGSFKGVVVHGRLDRKKLGELVFADPAALERLNEITHRHVGKAVEEILKSAADEGRKLAAVDAIALIESGLSKKCDFVIGVVAPARLRIERIMRREGITREYAEKRLRAQKDDSFFRENSDMLLVNDFQSETEFSRYCQKVLEELENGENG